MTQSSRNTYVGIVVALAVAGFMFYGMSYLHSKIIGNNQDNTMSDLQSEVLAEGNGDVAENGDTVFVNYVGTLEDGTEFDSSYKRNAPIDFVLGTGGVIQGWEQGILGMKVGEKKRLTIPPELAYGASGRPGIPPNATLIFEVELVKVEKSVK